VGGERAAGVAQGRGLRQFAAGLVDGAGERRARRAGAGRSRRTTRRRSWSGGARAVADWTARSTVMASAVVKASTRASSSRRRSSRQRLRRSRRASEASPRTWVAWQASSRWAAHAVGVGVELGLYFGPGVGGVGDAGAGERGGAGGGALAVPHGGDVVRSTARARRAGAPCSGKRSSGSSAEAAERGCLAQACGAARWPGGGSRTRPLERRRGARPRRRESGRRRGAGRRGLVEGDAEAELVAAGADALALAEVLLGGHVRGRADVGVGLGERDAVAGRVGGRHDLLDGAVVDRSCEAEVEDADAAVVADQHVVGLEVAVDDADGVGGGEALTGLQEHGEDLAPLAGAEPGPLAEAEAGDQFHGEEHGVAELVDLVDVDDVGVGEAGHRLGLAEHAVLALAVVAGAMAAAHDLDGDAAGELGVLGLVDDAHAALAELAEDLEAADVRGQRLEHQGGARQRGHAGAAAAASTAFEARLLFAVGSHEAADHPSFAAASGAAGPLPDPRNGADLNV
jgi:hypothetical protein